MQEVDDGMRKKKVSELWNPRVGWKCNEVESILPEWVLDRLELYPLVEDEITEDTIY